MAFSVTAIASMLIPASEKAKENAKAADNSPYMSLLIYYDFEKMVKVQFNKNKKLWLLFFGKLLNFGLNQQTHI